MVSARQASSVPDKLATTLIVVALFLIFFGSRLIVIDYSATSVPFLDEWDGEGVTTLIPYIQGRLSIHDLTTSSATHHPVHDAAVAWLRSRYPDIGMSFCR